MFTGLQVPEHGVTAASDKIKPGETIFDTLQEQGYDTAVFSDNPYLTSLETGLESGFDTIKGGVQEPVFDAVNPDKYKGEMGAFLRAALNSGRPFRSLTNGVVSKLAWDYPSLVPRQLNHRLASGTTPGSMYTDLFCSWVEETTGPWAACINYMDTHHPYTPEPDFNEWDDGTVASIQKSISSMPLGFYMDKDLWWKCEILENLYDGTIHQVDHEIRRLIHFLRESDKFDDTMIVVTSDHGEGFGERSTLRDLRLAGHNVGEEEINLHVPLLIKHPKQRESKTIMRPVSLAAIPSAIRQAINNERGPYELTGVPVVARTQGFLESQANKLREQGIELDQFRGQTDVLYELDGETVNKWMAWNEKCVTMNCVDAQTSYMIAEGDDEHIRTVFEEFDEAKIKRKQNSREVDEITEQRLEDLGYR